MPKTQNIVINTLLVTSFIILIAVFALIFVTEYNSKHPTNKIYFSEKSRIEDSISTAKENKKNADQALLNWSFARSDYNYHRAMENINDTVKRKQFGDSIYYYSNIFDSVYNVLKSE